MDLAYNYPGFGYPKSVNRAMLSVAYTVDKEEEVISLDRDFAIIDLNVFGKIPQFTIDLSDAQKYPFILGVNNTTDTAGKVKVIFKLQEGKTTERTFNSNPKKNSIFSIQPVMPADEMYGYVMNVSESIAGVTVKPAAKNEGMTFEEANFALEGNIMKWTGKIPYYKANPAVGRIEGNRVGMQFQVPEGADLEKSYFVIDGKIYDQKALDSNSSGKVLNWWPLITTPGETKDINLVWMISGTAYIVEYQMKIDDEATLAGKDEALEN